MYNPCVFIFYICRHSASAAYILHWNDIHIFIVILYSFICRKCTILFFGGMSKCKTLCEYWEAVIYFRKVLETFQINQEKISVSLKKVYQKRLSKFAISVFQSVFWDSPYFIEFYNTGINLEPKLICPGGGNVAFQKQELTIFFHQIIEVFPFPTQVLQCLLLKPAILRYKILYLLLLESTACKISGC